MPAEAGSPSWQIRILYDAECPLCAREGRMLEFVVESASEEAQGWLTRNGAARVDASALTLEDIFLLAA